MIGRIGVTGRAERMLPVRRPIASLVIRLLDRWWVTLSALWVAGCRSGLPVSRCRSRVV